MAKKRKITRKGEVGKGPSAKGQHVSQGFSTESRTISVELQAEEELLFLGQASLVVEQGAAELDGACILPDRAPLDISADAQLGGPLMIKVAASSEQPKVPLAARSTTVICLTTDPRRCGCKVYRRSAADAPSFRLLPEEWHEANHSIVNATNQSGGAATPRIVVAGSRQIGKSTFTRHLVNMLLNSHPCVAFLDTDLGQPELTVSGLMSISLLTRPLLGPPHMHQRRPEYSLFLGDLSPQHEPLRCIQAVKSLYEWFCQHAAAKDPDTGVQAWPPLVVNTHGWIQGIGLDVLTAVLQTTWPTHVVMLQSNIARRNLPSHAFWLTDHLGPHQLPEIFTLPGIGSMGSGNGESNTMQLSPGSPSQESPAAKSLHAVEVRGLAWLAFAHRACGNRVPPGNWDAAAFAAAAHGLALHIPYILHFSDVKVQALHMAVPDTQMATVLNCAVVGLASSPPKAEEHDVQPEADKQAGGSKLLECLGVGIVRGVDASKRLLYILTDTDQTVLQTVNTLQVGRLELPSSLLQTSELLSPYLCMWSISTGGSGAGAIKSRNNLSRIGQQ